MLGYVRLILSLLVLLSHAGVRLYGTNPGVVAVIIFYMLAGMVVTHLWQDVLPQGKGKLMHFYKDRCLRIFPLYLFVMVLVLLFLLLTSYAKPLYAFFTLLNNVLIIPLNYYMYIDSAVLTDPVWCLIPPAWSLGAELQAYILLPLTLVFWRVRVMLFIASFSVYMAANMAYLNTDYYGYRLLAGVFFIFLIGSLIHEAKTSKTKFVMLVMVYLLIGGSYILFAYFNAFTYGYTKETMLGLLIGMPLIMLCTAIKVKIPLNKLAGSVSYAIFIMHFLVIWVLDNSQLIEKGSLLYFQVLIVVTIIAALIGVELIDARVDKIRMKK